MNQQPVTSQPTPVPPAVDEEDIIRVKSLNDLSFPNPLENAAQARGYINQVLMSIGKLQKTHGTLQVGLGLSSIKWSKSKLIVRERVECHAVELC